MTDGGKPPAGTGEAPLTARAMLNVVSRTGSLEYERVLYFSDAVFAIAITLLVVDLRVPFLPARQIHAGALLRADAPRILGFVISFAVIGLYWLAHHTAFRNIKALDRTLVLINLLFLGSIAFLPYPTALLSATSTTQPPAVIFYAACVSAAGLTQAAIWLYAMRAGLISDTVPPALRRYYAARMIRTPVVFGLSIPVAVAAPSSAAYLWLLVPVIGVLLRRFMLTEAKPRP